MDPRTARILVSAFLLLGFSIYQFVTYTSTTSFQSTFSLQPGLAYDFHYQLNPSDSLRVTFQENSGLPVNLYILSSAQFASYQAKNPFTYLTSDANVPSGTFSYTAMSQDTYTLFFDHGAGLANATETVYAQRSYATHISDRLFFGTLLLGAAVVDFYYAYRSSKRNVVSTPPAPTMIPPSFNPAESNKFVGIQAVFSSLLANLTTTSPSTRILRL